MSFLKYLRERWISYTFIISIFIFSGLVYKLDRGFNISQSNARYIIVGVGLLFVVFIAFDYIVFNQRVKNFKRYCDLNAPSQDLDDFVYPTDKEYAHLINNMGIEYEKYKGEIANKSLEQLEFITRWVHDVKVPISAVRLILESNEEEGWSNFYKGIDQELFSIEQSVQRIFYEIKSNNFHDDYKIEEVNTKKLIANALKGYSNLFSYKKLNISITGEDYCVLTDEKWSGYILSQIISNAIKYSPDMGEISINTSKLDKDTTISINNMGKGILKKDIGQIFNKGYTSSGDRDGMKATGYGLYLSQKLTNMLGHRLTVESEYGQYASFSLTFTENTTIYNVTQV